VTILVRDAREDDLTAMVKLLGELHDPPTAVPNHDTWERMLAQGGRTILLAELDGEPAGTADLSIAQNLTHGAKPRAYVENLAVDSARRRAGVGRALMTEIERRARAAGCYKVLLMSADHRTGAHRFYEELGYERCAVGFKMDIEEG
jgi:ribosomal protein S18 acetylase RimI-like enzyme